MVRWLRFNSLALVLFAGFVVFIVLQSVFGWQVRNEQLQTAGQAADSYGHYLSTGHFGEAVTENWESEFLQMGTYVLLTAYLVQKGSPESKPLRQKDRPEDKPENAKPGSPKLSKATGLARTVYANSLSIVLLGLFGLSFAVHLLTGTAEYNEERALEQQAGPVTVWQFLGMPDFWFQSLQNWQSEFLAVGALVVLSIFLRQHGSPQSKPVTAPHHQTGE